MNNILELFLTTFFHNEGIIPLTPETLKLDCQRILAGLSPEESEKMKRKFRKIWRREARNRMSKISSCVLIDIANSFGMGKNPSKIEKYRRKNLVYNSIRKKALEFTTKNLLHT